MIAKKKMDDYNWPDLYKQADEFMRQYIPETMIHTRVRSLFDSRPAVTVHFPAKGHKQELNLLQKKACFRRIRGTTVNGVRLIYATCICRFSCKLRARFILFQLFTADFCK
ncbi:hypothetical protein, partial [Dorea longicatena]|uniref:hypothetical protein n=1 Tax=Dorea longicatena TaxID=88431 RepID=UPI001106DD6A